MHAPLIKDLINFDHLSNHKTSEFIYCDHILSKHACYRFIYVIPDDDNHATGTVSIKRRKREKNMKSILPATVRVASGKSHSWLKRGTKVTE